MGNCDNKKGVKSQIKEIADSIERVLIRHSDNLREHYIKCFPCESTMLNSINMSSDFSQQIAFMSATTEMANQVIFQHGYVKAAKCFLESVNYRIHESESPYIADGIAVLKILDKKKNIFLISLDEDDFESIYETDNEYFSYMTSVGSLPGSRELTFTYLKNNVKQSENVFVVVNSACKYRGTDFSASGKQYFISLLKTVLDEIGINRNIDDILVYPFDFYFKSLREGLPVDYFISRVSKAYGNYMTVLSNIGSIMEIDTNSLIIRYAFASNNHVGTHYSSSGIQRLDEQYRALPKAQYVEHPPYITHEYQPMFRSIAIKSSNNLRYLETESVCRPLLTAEWLFNNIGDISGFDNTFICFGYLKSVEILLAKIIVDCYSGITMSVSNMKNIIISENTENELMLGNMIQFMSNNPESSLYSSPYCETVSKAMRQWTKEIRNGYFHKHTMEHIVVSTIRNRTFEIIYMILGLLPR